MTASALPCESLIISSFLSYVSIFRSQNKNTVKVHRVFPSRCLILVSAPRVPNSLVYCKRSVQKSLSRFMHVGIYPTRNFRYLRTCQGYGCQVVWAICLLRCFSTNQNSHSPCQTRGRPQTFYFRYFTLSTSCVFIKQSLLRLCDTHLFLQENDSTIYPEVTQQICRVIPFTILYENLILLIQPTCGGYRYGYSYHPMGLRAD